jgi:hypothetical protein
MGVDRAHHVRLDDLHIDIAGRRDAGMVQRSLRVLQRSVKSGVPCQTEHIDRVSTPSIQLKFPKVRVSATSVDGNSQYGVTGADATTVD